ncbi:oxidoreductase family, NAD-binding Rossmann fold domain containing protein [Nitzschia inconspicua]|uniref:Oxidoreductase family, NAD-binding Rossmann fold domain containing protein n=1 Tax=Nitzschia inconspicua TaxID=303405 RepID=A0A9K3KG98_9STRA|nr:oxidoreductase family, NAD-binding Rossmann fold domain containing protein [Nitzschia inconspicua]
MKKAEADDPKDSVARIAVIGCGWWSQGWHLPVLHNNPKSNLVAIVDSSPHPVSKLNPNLVSLPELEEKYHTNIFSSVQDLLQSEIGPTLDGVLIATPHATHYHVGKEFLEEIDRREKEQGGQSRPLHIMMEKPMTTDIKDAVNLFRLVHEKENREFTNRSGGSQFWLNHTANYREQTRLAREIIVSGRLGKIRHVTASFASPLKWIFNDPGNDGWSKPNGNMIGNGFAWGQSSHLLAFLFHILPNCDPKSVHCRMSLSKETGADIAHSATIECLDTTSTTTTSSETMELTEDNTVLINMSGTALLPGHQYTDPPIAKLLNIDVYGDDGSLHYSGNDLDPTSGHLEYRNMEGIVEILCDRFEFEAYDNDNYGPESIQSFVELCCSRSDGKELPAPGATVLDGLRSVQVIDAMYRSNAEKQVVPVVGITN